LHRERNFCITSRSLNVPAGRAPAADAAVARSIRRVLAAAPPRAKSLVVTVWGDAIAPHGGSVWLSGLIRLLAPLGLNERLVRTSVYRLAREGWLTARPHGRHSVYSLTPQGRHRFEDAYRRIYSPPQSVWSGRWDVVLAPQARLRAIARRELGKELSWAGFGSLAPGIFIRPEHSGEPEAAAAILQDLGVAGQVARVDAIDRGQAARPLASWVPTCWNLEAVALEYSAFIARFAGVTRRFKALKAFDPEQCFVVRTLLIHEFRRVILHDPQLPQELLPSRWPASKAYELCRDFYRLTHAQAERYLAKTLAPELGTLPPAAAYFHRRFGGL
jgi:phenylacetic acid degradation operon negative regulatory protein